MHGCDLTQRRKDPAKGSLRWTNSFFMFEFGMDHVCKHLWEAMLTILGAAIGAVVVV